MSGWRRARKPRAPKRLAEEELYWHAVKQLAMRARSVAELRRLLERRALRRQDVPTVLARVKKRGYLNDERFAETFAAARLENQRLGRVRVVHDLRLRLVAPEVAQRAVRSAYEGVDEAHLLRQHLARRLRSDRLGPDRLGHSGPPQNPQPLENPQKLASLYRALRRAGFSHGAVLAELRRLQADPELLEHLEEEIEEQSSDQHSHGED